MKQWLLFITLLMFILPTSFVFAQDNGMHYIISGTRPNNGENNVPPNLYIEAVGNSCSSSNQNDIYTCTIMIGVGISSGNPITDVGYPKVTGDLFSSDKVIISSPNDPGISTKWSGNMEWDGLDNFFHNFQLHIVNSNYPNGIILMPNTTYIVTIKGGADGLKAKYEKNYQPIEATLSQDYTFSFTTGNGSMPRRTLPVTYIPTKAPLINTPVSPTNIPTQVNNNQNNKNSQNNSRIQNPTVTPTIIKKEKLNIFQKIKLFFSDFFERLFIKKETINKTTKLLTPTQTPKLTPTINVSKSMADSKQVLIDLEKALSVTASITDKWSSINWLVENKEILPLVGQGFILGVNETSVVGKYGNYSLSTNIRDITEDALKPLQNAVKEFFLSNGFQKDDLNTFRSSEFSVTLFMGYTKGDLKCLVTLFSQSSLFGNFFCGIVDQTRLAWRKELTSAINTTNDLNIVVSVNKIVGNYAQGFVSSPTGRGGGAGWYAVKINNQWKEVWRGQQFTFTSCKSLQQYNFPKEIIDLDNSDACFKYQLPTPATKIVTLGLTIKYWEVSYYCEPEVIPTITPIISRLHTFPTSQPCLLKKDNSSKKSNLEYLSCINQQMQKQGEIRQQNIESLKKYCTILTPTPK